MAIEWRISGLVFVARYRKTPMASLYGKSANGSSSCPIVSRWFASSGAVTGEHLYIELFEDFFEMTSLVHEETLLDLIDFTTNEC